MIPQNLFSRLYKAPIHKQELSLLLSETNEQNLELELELLKAKGFPLYREGDVFLLQTKHTSLQNQKFCFVDIETTGASTKENQIIEIGAIVYENGKILDSFESFVYAPFVPDMITQITQITADMLKDAPPLQKVLADFKRFLGDMVFVAHNVEFDYKFLSIAMQQNGFGELLNPKLCTIDFARRTILSKRYSLQYLNEFLGINVPIAHRAYADALTAMKVFEIGLFCLPQNIQTTQDLIDFSRKKY